MRDSGNDINQVNRGGSGFSTAATNPQLSAFRKNAPSNLGMSGHNKTRFTSLGILAGFISKLALPDNRYRNYLMIQNKSSGDLFVGFGVQIGENGESGFLINAGGFLELDTSPPYNSIFVKGVIASQQVLVIEGTIDRNG